MGKYSSFNLLSDFCHSPQTPLRKQTTVTANLLGFSRISLGSVQHFSVAIGQMLEPGEGDWWGNAGAADLIGRRPPTS